MDVLAPLVAVFACSRARMPHAERAVGRSQSLVQPGERRGQGASRGTQAGARGAKAYFKEMKEANRKASRKPGPSGRRGGQTGGSSTSSRRGLEARAPGREGRPEIQLLRCEPQEYSGDAAIIGPKGGTLHMGDHELVIPQGALDRGGAGQRRGTHLVAGRREVPAARSPVPEAGATHLSYERCVRPTSADFSIAYLGLGNQVLELPPSVDDKSGKRSTADIDHFSRYGGGVVAREVCGARPRWSGSANSWTYDWRRRPCRQHSVLDLYGVNATEGLPGRAVLGGRSQAATRPTPCPPTPATPSELEVLVWRRSPCRQFPEPLERRSRAATRAATPAAPSQMFAGTSG